MDLDIDTTNKREQRKFGLTMAAAFAALGTALWVLDRPSTAAGLYSLAAAFIVLSLTAPRLLRPVMVVWLTFARVLNSVVIVVLLTFAFFAMVVPAGLLNRVLGRDPLKRAWDPNTQSYWEGPDDQPDDLESYFNQF